MLLLAGRRLPDADGLVSRAGHRDVSRRVQNHAADLLLVPLHRRRDRLRRQVVEPRGFVRPPREHLAAATADRESEDSGGRGVVDPRRARLCLEPLDLVGRREACAERRALCQRKQRVPDSIDQTTGETTRTNIREGCDEERAVHGP